METVFSCASADVEDACAGFENGFDGAHGCDELHARGFAAVQSGILIEYFVRCRGSLRFIFNQLQRFKIHLRSSFLCTKARVFLPLLFD
jgi:hypothetical protein